MAIDVTGASAYVALASRDIITKVVAGAETAKLLINSGNFQGGVKGEVAVLKMDAEVVLQDANGCSRTPAGNVVLTDAKITVVPLKDLQNLCPKALYKTYFSWALRTGADPSTEGWEPAFIDEVEDLRARKIANWIEKLIWLGDTTLVGTNNLKWFNGIIKQVGVAGFPITAVGTSVWAKLQSAFLQFPVDLRSQDDFRIFLGWDAFGQYGLEMANRNLFVTGNETTLHGTSAKIVAVSGLNGTMKAAFTRLSNLQYGFDGASDEEKATLMYSVETTNWYQDFYFSVGIKVIELLEISIVNITPDVPEPETP